ncbi:hypothetical protein EIB18_18340 [Caulobacter vibrioides]|nr:hypothetical protein CA608_20470 [Caulobacter vibrioides]AZH14465.1 hypothetical protein EIB18_18340 [Caulobacter vibrioides]PLR10806.1 hypothetical protein CVUC_12035 [Caulobacter vibrioides]
MRRALGPHAVECVCFSFVIPAGRPRSGLQSRDPGATAVRRPPGPGQPLRGFRDDDSSSLCGGKRFACAIEPRA